MYRRASYIRSSIWLLAASLVLPSIASAQSGFRDSNGYQIESVNPSTAGSDLLNQRGTPGEEPNPVQVPGDDGFVPAVAPETNLAPVTPRQSESGVIQPPIMSLQESYRPVIPGERDNQYEPVIPGRANLRSIIEGVEDSDYESPSAKAGVEVIRQRYPDGKVQVMREVAQDEEGNYYNHGEWRLFNRQGQVLAQGQFVNGVMDGVWQRWHPQNSGGIFSQPPFNLFRGPFLSSATFTNGRLDGVWTLMDNFERKIFEIPYVQGNRNGIAKWWYPNSTPMREASFEKGILDGPLREWNNQNKLIRQDEYIDGQKIVRRTTFYRPRQKQSENYFLESRLEPEGNDDWWQARPARMQPSGQTFQHGPAMAWHGNGQPKMKGQYKDNVRVGRFIWWHPNGQKQLDGSYDELGNKVGSWSWWHSNGLKAIQGQYDEDRPAGVWKWWNEQGKVTNEEDLDKAVTVVPQDEQRTDEGESESNEPAVVEQDNSDDTPQMNDGSGTAEGAPEFREPGFTESEAADSQDTGATLETPDSFEEMEEIFGEGEIGELPGKLVPDDEPVEDQFN